MNIDNQKEYWDEVAEIKTFTHPIDLELINNFLNNQSRIVDLTIVPEKIFEFLKSKY
jgi:hypothetical protein